MLVFLNTHQNPVVVGKLQHENGVSGSVIKLGVAPPAVSNNERDFGLHSHCWGVVGASAVASGFERSPLAPRAPRL